MILEVDLNIRKKTSNFKCHVMYVQCGHNQCSMVDQSGMFINSSFSGIGGRRVLPPGIRRDPFSVTFR